MHVLVHVDICTTSHSSIVIFGCVHMQAQYVFIHDALNELIMCGQTDMVASGQLPIQSHSSKGNHWIPEPIPGMGM